MRTSRIGSWRRRFVGAVYATHNTASSVQGALQPRLERLAPGQRGLNVGAGLTTVHLAVVNVDIAIGPTIHACAAAEHLPFQDQTFDFVMSQEVLEHVRDPFRAMREMKRVLRAGGTLYCQVPFIIGYHPGPTDFWRFTREGIRELVEQAGLECEHVQIAVGPGTGAYRIAVEFFATMVGRLVPPLYTPAKGVLALTLLPLKWLDAVLNTATQADRIAGGYLVIASRS